MSRRLSALTAVAAALLVCLGGSPSPAQDRQGATPDRTSVTGAEWHRLHPLLCHTAGDHELR
jgi:hypothetical protein